MFSSSRLYLQNISHPPIYLIKSLISSLSIFGSFFSPLSCEIKYNFFINFTKKIISTAVKIKYGLANELLLGNLDSVRDWGYSPDYVQAMWKILQLDSPSDFIISTGELHSVREFLNIAFSYLNLDYMDYVKVDPKFYREGEKIPLCGNPEKINKVTGWKNKKKLESIIYEMIDNEKNILTKS